MRFATILSLATTALAYKTAGPDYYCEDENSVLNQDNLEYIKLTLARVMGPSFDKSTAENFLAKDFTDVSESVNSVYGIQPLSEPLFKNRDLFIAIQTILSKNHRLFPMHIGKASYGDDTATLVWHQHPNNGTQQVRGISLLSMCCEDNRWKVHKMDVEMNSFAYTNDIGGICKPAMMPPSNSTSSK